MRVNEEIPLEVTDLSTLATSEEIQLEHMAGYSVFISYTGDCSQMATEVSLEVTNNGTDWFEYHTDVTVYQVLIFLPLFLLFVFQIA